MKKYYGAGVIPTLLLGDKKYIALVKRSDDAPVNPAMHSGFFGGVELSKGAEFTNPNLIASRELSEEFFVVSSESKNFYILEIENGYGPASINFAERFKLLWKTEKEFDFNEKPTELLSSKITESLEFMEHDGLKKAFIVEFSLPKSCSNIDELLLLDGETKDERTPKGLLDRQIDLFDLEEFKNWWLTNESAAFISAYSFKSGYPTRKGFISRERNKISPTLILTLNTWIKTSPT